MTQSIRDVIAVLESAGVRYAVIGGHAVNAWVEPRLTADIDVTVDTTPESLAALGVRLAAHGYQVERETGVNLPSGVDFVRFVTSDRSVVLELQTAKTSFQQELIRRAVRDDAGSLVATVEDLIVLKLIADRRKDANDLAALLALPGVDWAYVEHWCDRWDISERLEQHRAAARPRD